jgi:hypothetical protein
VDQVIECLLCKHEALSSNPSTDKKKKNSNGIFQRNKTILNTDMKSQEMMNCQIYFETEDETGGITLVL